MEGIIEATDTIPYTQVTNKAVRDDNLGAIALGIYSYLSSHNYSSRFKLKKEQVRKRFKELGRTLFNKGWSELERKGWVESRRVQDERGRFTKWKHDVRFDSSDIVIDKRTNKAVDLRERPDATVVESPPKSEPPEVIHSGEDIHTTEVSKTESRETESRKSADVLSKTRLKKNKTKEGRTLLSLDEILEKLEAIWRSAGSNPGEPAKSRRALSGLSLITNPLQVAGLLSHAKDQAGLVKSFQYSTFPALRLPAIEEWVKAERHRQQGREVYDERGRLRRTTDKQSNTTNSESLHESDIWV